MYRKLNRFAIYKDDSLIAIIAATYCYSRIIHVNDSKISEQLLRSIARNKASIQNEKISKFGKYRVKKI